jgi:hypothetical protein
LQSISVSSGTFITNLFPSIALGQFAPLVVAAALAAQPASAQVADTLRLQLDAARSGADIALGGNLHTVKGTFLLKRGDIQFDPATGKVSGEVAFDATSGKTGNGSRDNKMHKDVIESGRYPEIIFRPNRAEGTLVGDEKPQCAFPQGWRHGAGGISCRWNPSPVEPALDGRFCLSWLLPSDYQAPIHFPTASRISANFFTLLFPQPASGCSDEHELLRRLASRMHLLVASSPAEKFDENESNRV